MAVELQGRIAPLPPPPLLEHIDETFVGAYPWNAPRSAIGRDRHLARGEFRQLQGVLGNVKHLPYVLKTLLNSRYDFIRRTKSPLHGFYFLKNTVEQRVGRMSHVIVRPSMELVTWLTRSMPKKSV